MEGDRAHEKKIILKNSEENRGQGEVGAREARRNEDPFSQQENLFGAHSGP